MFMVDLLKKLEIDDVQIDFMADFKLRFKYRYLVVK